MGDFLKSAMNYFNTVPSAGAENDFVGQIIEVQALKLRIKRLIAEGEIRLIDFFFFLVLLPLLSFPLARRMISNFSLPFSRGRFSVGFFFSLISCP